MFTMVPTRTCTQRMRLDSPSLDELPDPIPWFSAEANGYDAGRLNRTGAESRIAIGDANSELQADAMR